MSKHITLHYTNTAAHDFDIICSLPGLIFSYSRYLTTMQLGQFMAFFIHATFPLFIPCDFPKIFSYVILFHGAMFFLLFLNFYRQAYLKKDMSKKVGSKADINGNGVLKKE